MPKLTAFYIFNDLTVYDAEVRKVRGKFYKKTGRPKTESIEPLPFEINLPNGNRRFLHPSEDIREGNETYNPTTFETSLFDTFWGKVLTFHIPTGFYILVQGKDGEPGKFYRHVGWGDVSEERTGFVHSAFVTKEGAQRFVNKVALGRLCPFGDSEEIDEAVAEFKHCLSKLKLKLFYNEDEGTLQVLKSTVYTATKNDYDETDPRYSNAVPVPPRFFYSLDLGVTYTRNNDDQFAVQAFPAGNPEGKSHHETNK